MFALYVGHVRQRLHILGEARTTVAQTGIQEGTANTLVITHARCYFFHICAQRLADIGDLVDEADLGRQKSVAGVFDHLGRTDIRHDNRRAQSDIQLRHLLGSILAERTQHHSIGVHEILNRRAFAQEFRVADHIKWDGRRLLVAHNIRNPVTCANRHRALVDDDQRVIHGLCNGFSSHAHIAQLGLTIHTHRCIHRNKGQIGQRIFAVKRLCIGCRKVQPASGHIALNQFLQSGFEDG